MALLNTTEIPLDDNVRALDKYTELIESDKIIMIILGDSDTIQKGLILADKLARQISTNQNLWVMWVGNHIVLKNKLISILQAASTILDNTTYKEIKAFCLTKKPRQANTRIHLNGALSPFRLTKLYREAIQNSEL